MRQVAAIPPVVRKTLTIAQTIQTAVEMAPPVITLTVVAIVPTTAAVDYVMVALGISDAPVIMIPIAAKERMQLGPVQVPMEPRVLAQRRALALMTKPTATPNQDAHGKPQSH